MSITLHTGAEFMQVASFLTEQLGENCNPVMTPQAIALILFQANRDSLCGHYLKNVSAITTPDFSEQPTFTGDYQGVFFKAREMSLNMAHCRNFKSTDAKRYLDMVMSYALANGLSFNDHLAPITDVRISPVGHFVRLHDNSGFCGFVCSVGAEAPSWVLPPSPSNRYANVAVINVVAGEVQDRIVAVEAIEAIQDQTYPTLNPFEAKRLSEHLAQLKEERRQVNIAKAEQEKQQQAIWEDEVRSIMPAGTKSIIVAELHNNTSESISDLFQHETLGSVIIGFSKHTRDLFSEMRKAAGLFNKTAHLSTAPKEAEHREKWSMGGGYYLKDGSRHSSGWSVQKMSIEFGIPQYEPAEYLKNPKTAAHTNTKKENNSKGGGAGGPHGVNDVLRFNEQKGGIELHFDGKPTEEILKMLRSSKFRFSRRQKLWFAKDSPGNRDDAVLIANAYTQDDSNGHSVEASEKDLESLDMTFLSIG